MVGPLPASRSYPQQPWCPPAAHARHFGGWHRQIVLVRRPPIPDRKPVAVPVRRCFARSIREQARDQARGNHLGLKVAAPTGVPRRRQRAPLPGSARPVARTRSGREGSWFGPTIQYEVTPKASYAAFFLFRSISAVPGERTSTASSGGPRHFRSGHRQVPRGGSPGRLWPCAHPDLMPSSWAAVTTASPPPPTLPGQAARCWYSNACPTSAALPCPRLPSPASTRGCPDTPTWSACCPPASSATWAFASRPGRGGSPHTRRAAMAA